VPLDLAALVDPVHTVVVTQECQVGVLGEQSAFPELASVARDSGLLEAAGRLVAGARAAGVDVVHCVAARRPDGRGSNHNARLFAVAAKADGQLTPGSEAVEVCPEIGVEGTDVVLTRLHGLGPMGGTDLDVVLRNLGARTVVGVGVSVNIGMTDFAFDAVNAGYQFVLPRDAVAGVPTAYADAVIDNTLSLVATVTTVDAVLGCWS
jgi:nicotinamidase-related amidase